MAARRAVPHKPTKTPMNQENVSRSELDPRDKKPSLGEPVTRRGLATRFSLAGALGLAAALLGIVLGGLRIHCLQKIF